MFEEGLLNDNLSPSAGLLLAYGIYLSNGGTMDGFMDLTEDEVQLIYTTYMGLKKKEQKENFTMLAKMFNQILGGGE